MKRLSPVLLALGVAACGATDTRSEAVRTPDADATAEVVPTAAAAQTESADADAQEAKPKKAAPKRKGPSIKQLQSELTKAQTERSEAQRKQRYADASLEIAELDSAATELGVVESLRAARADLERARAAMEAFDSVARPLRVRKADLDGRQAKERLRQVEADLVGVLEIYEEETEARTKDEVILKYRIQVDLARERVALNEAERAQLMETTLPAEMREKAEGVRKAEASLAKAEAQALKTRRKSEADLEKAADEADDGRKKAKAAGKKVERARRRLNDAREADAARKAEAAAKSAAKDADDGASEAAGEASSGDK
ncbi:MAG: hypothetical protein AAGB93_19055 [Planctomycetota bacterium]